MSHITLAIRHAPQSERLFRWHAAVIAAFAGGSLTAALLQLVALAAPSLGRSAVSHGVTARCEDENHA